MIWMKFNLIDRPFYDNRGDIISRSLYTDRYGLAKIYGGGKIYPDICFQKSKIIEWHEKGSLLLLKLDISADEALHIKEVKGVRTYNASPKIILDYNMNDFTATIISDEDAEATKKAVFGIPVIVESGVS